MGERSWTIQVSVVILFGRLANWGLLQDRHENGKPDVFCSDQGLRIGIVFTTVGIVGVAQNDKRPGRLYPSQYCEQKKNDD